MDEVLDESVRTTRVIDKSGQIIKKYLENALKIVFAAGAAKIFLIHFRFLPAVELPGVYNAVEIATKESQRYLFTLSTFDSSFRPSDLRVASHKYCEQVKVNVNVSVNIL